MVVLREEATDNFKECLRMEALCKQLALAEPDNKERWRAEAKKWHRRAGQFVTSAFGDVPLPPSTEESQSIG